MFGVGINDVKEYTKGTKPYLVWKSMLARCYSDYTRRTNPAYDGCSVCEEWLTFSNFRNWFFDNYRDGMQLDKDIIVPGNKVYSPETCCFVPQEVNKLFKGHSRSSGISAGVRKQNRRYVAEFRADGRTYKASFPDLNQAQEFYRRHRSERLKAIGESYLAKGMITDRIYNAIIKYGLELYGR